MNRSQVFKSLTFLQGALIALSITLIPAPFAYAHGGDEHAAPSDSGSAMLTEPLTLSTSTVKNLGIESMRVTPRSFPITVNMFGIVAALPEKYAKVSTRFSGRIKSIFAKVGQSVKKEDLLLIVEPLQVGSSDVSIRAPIAGTITAQSFEALGEPVSPETTLLEIIDTSEVLIRGELYESPDFSQIAVGQRAEAITPLSGEARFQGVVDRINPSLQPGSLTFEVFAKFPNPEKRLVINTHGDLSVIVSELRDRLVVPRSALLGSLGSYYLFIRSGSTFTRRRVEVGAISSNDVEIAKGLTPGEEVVTTGHYQLQFARSDSPAKKGAPAVPNEKEPTPHTHEDKAHSHSHDNTSHHDRSTHSH